MSETVTPPAAPPAAPAATPWHHGVDPEIIGRWQNKGWFDKSPAEIAVIATKAHAEAERYVGAPADKLARIPNDLSDTAGWKSLWAKLGAPADPSGYDFADVKFSDGEAVSASFTDWMRQTAAAHNLPKSTAAEVAKSVAKFVEDSAKASEAEQAAALAGERDRLRQNWGANFEVNKHVAQNAAMALGVGPEEIAALEGAVGYAKTMEMFRQIGTKIGEDKFVSGGGAPGGPMTVEAARASLAELKADKAWVRRYLDGDVAARRTMENLTRIIVGTE